MDMANNQAFGHTFMAIESHADATTDDQDHDEYQTWK